MRLQSVLDMVGGELMHSTSITHFKDIQFYPKSVNRGDLFIAFKKNSILEAIENGAYGVLFDGELTLDLSRDVATISVESLMHSSIKLLRFILLNRTYKFFFMNSIMFHIAKRINSSSGIIFLKDSYLDNFHKIINADNETIFFSYDEDFISKIWPLYSVVDNSGAKIELIKRYLFEINIKYNREYYHRLRVPPIFLKELSKLLKFYEDEKLSLSLRVVNFIRHFEPVYIDKFLNSKEFGKSDRVLIFEPNYRFADIEIRYLEESTKWGDRVYLISEDLVNLLNLNIEFITFKGLDELSEILKSLNFNFALIIGISFRDLKPKFNKKEQIVRLF